MRQSRVGYCNVVSRSVDGPVDVDGPASSSDKVRGFKIFGGDEIWFGRVDMDRCRTSVLVFTRHPPSPGFPLRAHPLKMERYKED